MRKIIMSIGAVLLCLSLLTGCGTSHRGEVRTAAGADVYKGMDYQAAAESFEKRGFTAVSTVALEDLSAGQSAEEGKVDSVSVGGDSDFPSDSLYPADSEVIISYHSFPSEEQTEQTAEKSDEQAAEKNDGQAEGGESTAAEQEEDAQPSDSTMPVMKGADLESAADEAGRHGLSQLSDDTDFGHGTKWRTMSTDNGGLMLDIIYSDETGEILMGTITTSAAADPAEQISFIKSMSKHLCPEGSSGEVEAWVASNVGSSDYTTIDDFVYQLGSGAADNEFFFAGQQNWEEWELSHYE